MTFQQIYSLRFFSLHQSVAKNQKPNTKFLCLRFCFVEIQKRKRDSLVSSLFKLQQQKSKQLNSVFGFWFLFLLWNYFTFQLIQILRYVTDTFQTFLKLLCMYIMLIRIDWPEEIILRLLAKKAQEGRLLNQFSDAPSPSPL